MLSAGLGWIVGGLKVSFRVDQKLLPGLSKSCFPGGTKIASRSDQKLLLGWTKECFRLNYFGSWVD